MKEAWSLHMPIYGSPTSTSVSNTLCRAREQNRQRVMREGGRMGVELCSIEHGQDGSLYLLCSGGRRSSDVIWRVVIPVVNGCVSLSSCGLCVNVCARVCVLCISTPLGSTGHSFLSHKSHISKYKIHNMSTFSPNILITLGQIFIVKMSSIAEVTSNEEKWKLYAKSTGIFSASFWNMFSVRAVSYMLSATARRVSSWANTDIMIIWIMLKQSQPKNKRLKTTTFQNQ